MPRAGVRGTRVLLVVGPHERATSRRGRNPPNCSPRSTRASHLASRSDKRLDVIRAALRDRANSRVDCRRAASRSRASFAKHHRRPCAARLVNRDTRGRQGLAVWARSDGHRRQRLDAEGRRSRQRQRGHVVGDEPPPATVRSHSAARPCRSSTSQLRDCDRATRPIARFCAQVRRRSDDGRHSATYRFSQPSQWQRCLLHGFDVAARGCGHLVTARLSPVAAPIGARAVVTVVAAGRDGRHHWRVESRSGARASSSASMNSSGAEITVEIDEPLASATRWIVDRQWLWSFAPGGSIVGATSSRRWSPTYRRTSHGCRFSTSRPTDAKGVWLLVDAGDEKRVLRHLDCEGTANTRRCPCRPWACRPAANRKHRAWQTAGHPRRRRSTARHLRLRRNRLCAASSIWRTSPKV